MRGVDFLTVVHERSVFSDFGLLSMNEVHYDIFELLSVRGVHFQTVVHETSVFFRFWASLSETSYL